MAWGCSDGKFNSHLSLQQNAGLRCGLEIPSLCPDVSLLSPKCLDNTTIAVFPLQRQHKDHNGHWGNWLSRLLYHWTKNIPIPGKVFAPYVSLKKHRLVLEAITWHISVLSNWAQHAFGELNTQVQQTAKMTLQNRLAVDMILLKEQRLCGMLNLTESECYVTTHNTSTFIEEARAERNK